MTAAAIEAYLHRRIPISAAMGIRVQACDAGGATLAAPIAPNVNHRATVFGGSASAVAILAGWSWLHFLLSDAGRDIRLVIQSNSVEYVAPITDDFVARCDAPEPAAVARFLATLRRRGKARIELRATLSCGGKRAVDFRGTYVAFRKP